MTRWTNVLFGYPWVTALSVAVLGTTVAATTVAITHNSHPHAQVRVLGEHFQNLTPSGPTAGPAGAPPNASSPGSPNLSLTVSASVNGLVLGRPDTLPIQITNPRSNGGSMTVDTVNVVVRDIVNAGGQMLCGASNLRVGGYDMTAPGATGYTIASGQSMTVPLAIELVDSPTVNQDSCRGQSFPLQIQATATVRHP